MILHNISLLIIGIAGLWLGSSITVDAAKDIATKLKVSGLIVGLTITSIGTSLPEIITNIHAAMSILEGKDASGIAVGNIIGSDLGQITLILGLVGFAASINADQKTLRRDGCMTIIALLLMWGASMNGIVTPLEGTALVLTYIAYLTYILKKEQIINKFNSKGKQNRIHSDILKIAIGLMVVVYSANLAVQNGVLVAESMGVHSFLIGLLIGFGTSLPELTVSMNAALKKSKDLSIGNLIGSNITDPLLSFGLGAMIAGVNVERKIIYFDFPYWLFSTILAIGLLAQKGSFNRRKSLVLILAYIVFIMLEIRGSQ